MAKKTLKRPEQTVPLCLDLSLRAEWEKAEADLAKARQAPRDDRLSGDTTIRDLATAVRTLEERMTAETIYFRLRALRRSKWSEIVDANPPRPENGDDQAAGLNRETFFDAVMTATDDQTKEPLTIVEVRDADDEPVEFSVEEWSDLADDMTDAQYELFADVIATLNRGRAVVPFSRAASRLTSDSDGS